MVSLNLIKTRILKIILAVLFVTLAIFLHFHFVKHSQCFAYQKYNLLALDDDQGISIDKSHFATSDIEGANSDKVSEDAGWRMKRSETIDYHYYVSTILVAENDFRFDVLSNVRPKIDLFSFSGLGLVVDKMLPTSNWNSLARAIEFRKSKKSIDCEKVSMDELSNAINLNLMIPYEAFDGAAKSISYFIEYERKNLIIIKEYEVSMSKQLKTYYDGYLYSARENRLIKLFISGVSREQVLKSLVLTSQRQFN